MSGKNDKNVKEDLVRQIMNLAADRGWDHIELCEVEGASEHFENKTDILVAFGRMIDRQVMENFSDIDPDISPRDYVFDILMDRYEMLNEYRSGLVSILNSFKLDPKQAVISMPHICQSMSTMLEAAGMETGGVGGAIKVTGITGVYLKVLKVWKDDDSPDLGKTMAALDKDLGRVERAANFLGF